MQAPQILLITHTHKPAFMERLQFFKSITYCAFFLYSWTTKASFWKICRSLLYATLHLASARHISLGLNFTASAKGIPVPKWKLMFGLHHSLLANKQLPNLHSLNWKNHKSQYPFYPGWNRVCSVLSFFASSFCCIFSFLHSHSLSLLFRSPEQYKMPRIDSSDPSEFLKLWERI